jgi:hypothetical protein
VNHADRLAAVLRRMRIMPVEGLSAAWLCGRAEEVELFVATVARSWRLGEVPEKEAAAVVASYLEALHAGLRVHFGEAAVECCDATTRELPMATARPP